MDQQFLLDIVLSSKLGEKIDVKKMKELVKEYSAKVVDEKDNSNFDTLRDDLKSKVLITAAAPAAAAQPGQAPAASGATPTAPAATVPTTDAKPAEAEADKKDDKADKDDKKDDKDAVKDKDHDKADKKAEKQPEEVKK